MKINNKVAKNIIFFIMLIILIVVIYIIFEIEKKIEETETENTVSKKMEEDTTENTLNHNDIQSNEISNTTVNSYNENIYHDEFSVPYEIENNKYYGIINNNKVEVISLEKAADIADEEAKKDKYQYQPWVSEFYTRGKNRNDPISADLITDLSSISRFSHWNEEWKVRDYKDKLMWKIRLFDENDPLTSLYIYIDAENGDIIGAGDSSD